LVKSVHDLKPGGLKVDEDMTPRPNSRIIVEGPGGNTDDIPVHRWYWRATQRAECPSVPWWRFDYWCLIGLNERLTADRFKFGRVEFQFS
jgi:hypothetical protein